MISRRVWLVIVGLVCAYAIGIALDVTPLLRGPEEWRWPRAPILYWDRLWPIMLVLLLAAVWVIWIDRRMARSATSNRRWIVVGVGGLMFAVVALQAATLRMERQDAVQALFLRATGFYANGYFTVGTGIQDVSEFLRRYPELMPGFPLHPQVHPPGLPLLYWLTGQVLTVIPSLPGSVAQMLRPLDCNNFLNAALTDRQLASALAGMLLPTVANVLTIASVYFLAKDRFGRRAGFLAAALWALVPSSVIFSGSWSQAYPLLACLVWLCLDAGLRRRQLRWFALAGVFLSVSTFMELGTAALALFMVLYVGARYLVDRRNPLREWKFLSAALLIGLAGVFSLWIMYQVLYGVSLNQIVAAMWPIHTGYQFNRVTWMFNHPYEFSVFVGLPVAVLLVAASVRAVRQVRAGEPADPMSLSLGFGLIILSVIDPARDETARTWMPFMPLAVVVVSQFMVLPAFGRRQIAALWAMLSVQLIAMSLFMQFILFGVPADATPAALASLPPEVTPLQAKFDGQVRLAGYGAKQTAPGQWHVDLYWQPAKYINYPYTIFTHLLDTQNQLVGQHDATPQPYMTCWQPNRYYLDEHSIPLTTDQPANRPRLEVGLYNAETGQRVPVLFAGQPSDHVILALPGSP